MHLFFADDPARLAFLSASPRPVGFLDCKTETAGVLSASARHSDS